MADRRMWNPQWSRWADRHSLLRLDLPGFGRSAPIAGPHSAAGAVLGELQRRGIGRAAFVGASFGGQVALELAVARPKLVAALVVVGAPLPDHAWSAAAEAFGAEEAAALARGDLDAAVEANLRTWVDGFGRDPQVVDPGLRAFVGTMQRLAFERSGEVAGDQEELLVPNLGTRLGEIRAPTLALAGAHDLPDMLAIAERLAREIPGARHAVVPGAAHLPSLERPETFDAVVLPFLAQPT